jgi:hypothetical protein
MALPDDFKIATCFSYAACHEAGRRRVTLDSLREISSMAERAFRITVAVNDDTPVGRPRNDRSGPIASFRCDAMIRRLLEAERTFGNHPRSCAIGSWRSSAARNFSWKSEQFYTDAESLSAKTDRYRARPSPSAPRAPRFRAIFVRSMICLDADQWAGPAPNTMMKLAAFLLLAATTSVQAQQEINNRPSPTRCGRSPCMTPRVAALRRR